jgi:hypothetical protein
LTSSPPQAARIRNPIPVRSFVTTESWTNWSARGTRVSLEQTVPVQQAEASVRNHLAEKSAFRRSEVLARSSKRLGRARRHGGGQNKRSETNCQAVAQNSCCCTKGRQIRPKHLIFMWYSVPYVVDLYQAGILPIEFQDRRIQPLCRSSGWIIQQFSKASAHILFCVQMCQRALGLSTCIAVHAEA